MLLKNQSTLNEIRDQEWNNAMQIIDSKLSEWNRFAARTTKGDYVQTSIWTQTQSVQE